MTARCKLSEIAKTIRSKNAGVDKITFDILYEPYLLSILKFTRARKFSCNPICTCNGPQSAFRMPPQGGTAWRARPQFVKRPRLDGAGRAGRSQ